MAITVFLDADEITAESFAVSVERGRSLEADVFRPGGGTIRVRNYQANFNPYFLVQTDALLLESGDFLLLENNDRLLLESGNGTGAGSYGEIKVGRKVIVKDGAVTVFTGFVEDFDFEYDAGGKAEAILTVRDALATLGATDFQAWVPDQQLTGARVSAILDRSEVGFPTGAAARSIATGTQPLQAGTSTTDEATGVITYGTGSVQFGTNVLQELQRVNRAESGRLFVDASGKLIFQDRYDSFGQTPTVTFDDTGANLPFHDIDIRFGTELLHFSVSVQRDGGIVQTDTDSALVTEYANLGVRHLSVPPVPYNSDHHSLGLARFLLDRFAQFKAVISGLTIKLGDLSTSDRATVCGLDIGDIVQVTWTPVGTSGPVTQTLAVEAVTYNAVEHMNTASVSFQLTDASDPDYFIVGTDSVNGANLLAP